MIQLNISSLIVSKTAWSSERFKKHEVCGLFCVYLSNDTGSLCQQSMGGDKGFSPWPLYVRGMDISQALTAVSKFNVNLRARLNDKKRVT